MQKDKEAAEYILNCGHLAPTAPHTLKYFPFQQKDPLVLENAPEYFIVGNSDELSWERVAVGEKEVKVLMIPKLEEAGGLLLLDVEKDTIYKMKFK